MEPERPKPVAGVDCPAIDIFRGVYGALFGMAVTLAIFLAIFGVYLALEIDRRGLGAFHPRAVGLWLAPFIGCAVLGVCAGWATYAPSVNGKRFNFAKTLAILFFTSIPLLAFMMSVISSNTPRMRGTPRPSIEDLVAPQGHRILTCFTCAG